jgi:adenylosuccinate synthase
MKRKDIEAAEKQHHSSDQFAIFVTRRHGMVRLETEAEWLDRKNHPLGWKVKPRIGTTISVVGLAATDKKGRSGGEFQGVRAGVTDRSLLKNYFGESRFDLAPACIQEFVNKTISIADYFAEEIKKYQKQRAQQRAAEAAKIQRDTDNAKLRDDLEDKIAAILARRVHLSRDWAGSANATISLALLNEILTKLNGRTVWS